MTGEIKAGAVMNSKGDRLVAPTKDGQILKQALPAHGGGRLRRRMKAGAVMNSKGDRLVAPTKDGQILK